MQWMSADKTNYVIHWIVFYSAVAETYQWLTIEGDK